MFNLEFKAPWLPWHENVLSNHKVTLSSASNPYQSLHLSIVWLCFSLALPLTFSRKKLLSEHASIGVTSNFVSGHLTSKRPKGDEQPILITPSGEAPKYGASRLITRPDFRTCTGQWMENMYLWYCSRASVLYWIPWLAYCDVKGMGCNRLSTKFSRCLFLAIIKPKFEDVNLNFHPFFHSSQLDCFHVFFSISLILSSLTQSLFRKVLFTSGIPFGTMNLEKPFIGSLWVRPRLHLGTDATLPTTCAHLLFDLDAFICPGFV